MRQFPSIVIYRCAAPVILVMIFTVLAYWIAAGESRNTPGYFDVS